MITDSYLSLSDRERHFLKKTWAIPFSEYLFPIINEEPYHVLYSDKDSRPNTPVNIIIGALLLKELNGLSDEGLLYAMLFDIRYQVALHTTSFTEQPVSDRTLSRFRERCLLYQQETGIDLIHNTMCELAEHIQETFFAPPGSQEILKKDAKKEQVLILLDAHPELADLILALANK